MMPSLPHPPFFNAEGEHVVFYRIHKACQSMRKKSSNCVNDIRLLKAVKMPPDSGRIRYYVKMAPGAFLIIPINGDYGMLVKKGHNEGERVIMTCFQS